MSQSPLKSPRGSTLRTAQIIRRDQSDDLDTHGAEVNILNPELNVKQGRTLLFCIFFNWPGFNCVVVSVDDMPGVTD